MFAFAVDGAANRPIRRRVRRRLEAAVMVALLVPPGLLGAGEATGQTAPALSLRQALQIAEQRSTGLRAQEAAVRASRERAVAAGQLPDPVLGLSVDNLPVEGSNRFSLDAEAMTMRSLSLRQTYTDSAKRDARSQRFQRQAEVARATRQTQLAELRTLTAQAWLDRYYQHQLLDLLRRQLEAAERTAAAVEAAFRSNRAAQEQVIAARIASARINDRLLEAEADLRNTRATLARWVGAAADRPLQPPPAIDTLGLPIAELTRAFERHPDLALMDARERLAMAEARVARSDKGTDWTWSMKWGFRDDQFGDMVSIGVSIPLQWNQSDSQDRELAASLEQARQLRDEREEIRRRRLAEVERLASTWRSNLARLRDYDRSLIPLTSDRTRAAEAAFGAGEGSLATALDARRIEIDLRVERLRIERQTAQAWAELEHLFVDAADAGEADATPSNEEHHP